MQPLQQLAFGRILIGVLSWVAPSFVAKVFGIGGPTESHMPSRLFGARDLALGVGTLTTTGETQKQIVRLGVLCDALDVGAAVVGKREGSLPKAPAVALGVIAAGAVAVGASSLK
ncbi:hypothetical protein [Conexibacter sp. SYSU D00693]|uniref:hypothetical protein n=1 Tax=Conexibacter sp. SYSU D00693 TaxID=2812560 RepID=UPI00196A6AC8|nr:hypothetical protein [Conexibacter sp. SYSU D00693]